MASAVPLPLSATTYSKQNALRARAAKPTAPESDGLQGKGCMSPRFSDMRRKPEMMTGMFSAGMSWSILAMNKAGMTMRIYVAGAMMGRPEFDYPALPIAAELRAAGRHVESPAESPAPACKSWAGYMCMTIVQLVTCDAIYLLPLRIDQQFELLKQ